MTWWGIALIIIGSLVGLYILVAVGGIVVYVKFLKESEND